MTGQKKDGDPIVLGFNPHYNTQQSNLHKTEISRYNLIGSTINEPRSVLTRSQLLECADSYVNDGIVRRCINTLVQGVKGQRVKFVVEPNEEISEILKDEELQNLNDQTTTKDRVPELKRKQMRIDKRCKLNDRLDTFLKSFFIFGRAISGIVRYPAGVPEFPRYGEPRAIQPLNSIRIENVDVDPVTYDLRGVEYDFGTDKGKKMIRPLNMIFGVNDDNNLYDNTNYSGTSLVWTILSTSQSNVIINDEDIPESTKQLAHKFGFIYTGTNKKSVTESIRNQLEMSTWLVHNQQGLTAQVQDLARDLTELPHVRTMNAEYMTWSLMVPFFLIDNNASNFATANQALQAWKATVIDYYRTIIQGILEQYWYDPLLADHYDVEIKDVLSQRMKMKPIFEDLIFDTYKDSVEATVALVNAGIITEMQALDKLGLDKYKQERQELEVILQKQKEESIRQREEELRKQQGQLVNPKKPDINDIQQQQSPQAKNLRKFGNPNNS